MKASFLLLGSKGMLGHALLEVFKKNGSAIGHSFDREELDVLDFDKVEIVLSEIKPAFVLNCAAYTNVDQAEHDKELALRINGEAVGNLAKICKQLGSTLVHFSTDYVFQGDKEEGYTEDDKPDELDELSGPVNVYGKSKALGERLLEEAGPSFYLIRSSWLYGPNGRNFVDTMVKLGEGGAPSGQNIEESGQKPISVVMDQIGKPTYTVDLARAVYRLINEKKPFGTYHLVNEGPVSWYDFSREIFAVKGIHKPVTACSSEEYAGTSGKSGGVAKRPHFGILVNTRFPHLRSWKLALRDYLQI